MSSGVDQIRDAVVAAAQECGEVEVVRSGPTTELRAEGRAFATITVGPRGTDLRMVLPGGHRLPGIVKLLSGTEDVARHGLRLRRLEDVDDEVRAWLCEAHRAAAGT